MSRLGAVLTALFMLMGSAANATPFFARQYGVACTMCHSGFPRLNEFGLAFKANNFRMPNAEKAAVLAWQKSVPIAVQIKPTYQRFHDPGSTSQFTDTQILAGGLLTQRTAFYLHDTLFFDGKPQPFPNWELWGQHVLDEKHKIMLKAGQFELPWAYSPEVNRTTISTPTLFFSAAVDPNDVTLGSTVSGLQLSAAPGKWQLYVEGGAPASNATGNAVGEREFFGRFRDVFLKVAHGEPSRNVGLFGYFTHPDRKRTDPSSEESAFRYGLDGIWLWKAYQFQGMAVYGENSDPGGIGVRGIVRGALLEVDRMFLKNAGATIRLDVASRSFNGAHGYHDAKTIALRYYPFPHLKLIGEQQWLDHGQSVTSIAASIAF